MASPSGVAAGSPLAASGVPAADEKMMIRPMNYEFRIGADVPALDTPASAWILRADAEPSDGQLRNLREVLGVDGDFVRRVEGEGEAWQYTTWVAGPSDGSGPSISVSDDAMLSWWYSPGYSAVPAVSCAVSAPGAVGASGGSSTGVDGTLVDPTIPVDTTPVPCGPTPEPPPGVPNKPEAISRFQELVSRFGYEQGDFVVEAYADDWSAGVTGWLKVGGVRSSVVVQASFGENGELTWAGGVLSRPEKFAEYPRIGTKAALERLTAQYNGAWVGTGGPMVRAADEAIAVGEPMPGSVATGTALPPDSIPTATLPVDTMPQPVETLTVDVERVEEELVFVWGADGSVYLVPGYAFVANQDGYESRYTVSAVPDEFVQQADAPVSDTVSPPAESTPTVGEKVPSGAEQTLVGLSEREAIAQAEANGWAVRVVSRDGVDLPVTMDYSESRVNLEIGRAHV